MRATLFSETRGIAAGGVALAAADCANASPPRPANAATTTATGRIRRIIKVSFRGKTGVGVVEPIIEIVKKPKGLRVECAACETGETSSKHSDLRRRAP